MSTPQLPGIFGALAPLLNSYGYLAVGGLLFLEDFGVPVPGETILIVSPVYAGAGQLNIVAVVLVGFLAAVLGDNLGFAIGHFGGRALVLRFGRYVFLTEERLGNAEAFFTRHGGKVVTIARFVGGLRQANGIVSGLAGMPWRRFLVFNALGAAIWVGAWSAVGYLAGNHLDTIYAQVKHYELYLLTALAVLAVALLIRHLLRRCRRDEHDRSRDRTPQSSQRSTSIRRCLNDRSPEQRMRRHERRTTSQFARDDCEKPPGKPTTSVRPAVGRERPVVATLRERRTTDVQLRVTDAITSFAGLKCGSSTSTRSRLWAGCCSSRATCGPRSPSSPRRRSSSRPSS